MSFPTRPLTRLCTLILSLYVLAALASFTPALTSRASLPLPQTATHTEYAPPALTDFPARLFGTDIQNRSVFYRTLYGTRTALIITLAVSSISLAIGVTLGILAGYFGGRTDDLITWLVTTVSSVPSILLILALVFVLKGLDLSPLSHLGLHSLITDTEGNPLPIPPLAIIILALGLTDWVGTCRLIRGEVLKQRSLDYVQAARALGFSQPRILFAHILPNTLHLVIITFTLSAVAYVQAEVFLTFLGIGISDRPSWGRMIDDAKLELLRGVWWQFTAATLAIGLLCLSLSLLGDALRDALDPKSRNRP